MQDYMDIVNLGQNKSEFERVKNVRILYGKLIWAEKIAC